jgi:hypothetical protein
VSKYSLALFILIGSSVLYFVLFILPDFWSIYYWTIGTQRMHAQELGYQNVFNVLIQHIEYYGFTYGIFATFLLMLVKKTKVIGFSATLFFIYTTFFQNVKKGYYVNPELLFFVFAVFISGLQIIKRRIIKHERFYISFVSILLLASNIFAFQFGNWKRHPLNTIRDWNENKLKTNPNISGRHGLWYVSGAHKWYNEENGSINGR